MGPVATDDAVLREATRRLVAEFRAEKVYLFGSRAWGEPTEDSDYDFMVIVASSGESPIRRAHRARRALRGMGLPKDIIVRTKAEFERRAKVHASLESQVMEQGRVLYG
jgi:predicted nucleotidyltransferase